MDMRRERILVHKHYDRFTSTVGEVIFWWQPDPATTSMHQVYDESPQRNWRPPISMPVLWISEQESPRTVDPLGMRPSSAMSFVIDYQTAEEVGLDRPDDGDLHLNDVIRYQGTYYWITNYQVRGRMRGDTTIMVTGNELNPDEELKYDNFPM